MCHTMIEMHSGRNPPQLKMDNHTVIIKRFIANLKKRLDYIRKEEENYYATLKCTFCGELDSICGGDHADEMREIVREADRRWYH